MDTCPLYQRKSGVLSVVVVLQVDDSISAGSDEFLRMEDDKARTFLSKNRKRFEEEPTIFNGVELSELIHGKIQITRKKKIESLVTPTTKEGFKNQRALA